MTYLGLDDQAVLDVAAGLERQLTPLQHVHGTITRHTSELGASGFGRRLESLIGDVAAVLPTLRAIEGDVSALVRSLRQQVASQQRQSGGLPQGLGGWMTGAFTVLGGTALLAGGSRAWNSTDSLLKNTALPRAALDGLGSLRENLKPGSHYGQVWRKLIKLDQGNDFLKYKKSPVLKMLYADTHLTEFTSFLQKSHVSQVLGGVGKLDTVMSTGQDGFQALDALSKGDRIDAISHGVDTAADLLKASKNPVTYLLGVNVSLYKKDAELAAQVDWKAGLPSPFAGDNLKTVYLAEAKDLPGQLWTNLKGVF